MRCLKVTIAYQGTHYVGWQVQPNGISIQHLLEKAWTCITHEKIRITASGRTDSGVHALRQVCSLSTDSQIPAEKIPQALNANLPFDIRVLEVSEAGDNFHAIRDATGKTYRYQIQTGQIQDPFQRDFRWFVPRSLNVGAMQTAAKHLLGRHDFSSFEAAGAPRQDSIRNVKQLLIHETFVNDFKFIDIEITADGFLYNMVRNIVGSLIVIGRERQEPSWIQTVLEARDRKQAGETAPAHGLFLVEVEYTTEA